MPSTKGTMYLGSVQISGGSSSVAANMLGRGGQESFLFVDVDGEQVLHALHVFTQGNQTFQQTADGDIEYLVVGGGGSGGGSRTGGGAGGVLYGTMTLPTMPDPETPVEHDLSVGGVNNPTTAFGMTAGKGGASNSAGGQVSGGSGAGGAEIAGGNGGGTNGGGGGAAGGTAGKGGNGGTGTQGPDFAGNGGGGGGGGAGGNGGNAGYRGGGGGGAGISLDITGTNVTYGRGGDGASQNGGGGTRAATPNSGGGGSGGGGAAAAGIVVIRYRVE